MSSEEKLSTIRDGFVAGAEVINLVRTFVDNQIGLRRVLQHFNHLLRHEMIF